MKPPPFAYAAPTSIDAAIALLTDGARPISGGQSLMPVLNFRLSAPSLLVDLRKIPGLDRIDLVDGAVHLGARVLWRMIEEDTRLSTAHPLLQAAIAHVAHYQVRNRGTVGGSLAHADPASELPGLAVTCDAVIVARGPQGTRSIPATDFFLGPLTTLLAADELITELRLPPWPANRHWAFEEFAHIGIIGACSRPQRLGAAEAVLEGRMLDADVIARAAQAASDAADPADDLHGDAAYRRALVGTLLTRCLERSA
jgi:carbon-monoxide dehydrogenase medium subunit